MPNFVLTTAFLAGTIIGSFLNVVALRSLSGESVLWPPSRCPACGHRLAALDLVPIFSYIALRGRCSYCRGRISPQYPTVEAATGAVFAALFARYGLTLDFFRLAVFAAALIVVTVTDLKEMTVPYAPLAGAAVAGVALKLADGRGGEIPGDMAAAAAVFAVMAFLSWRGLMGGGDAPVGALIALALGPEQTLAAVFIAVVMGGLYGVALLVKDSQNMKKAVPFVPFLAAGSVAAAVWPGIAGRLFWWWV
ncbi:type 4 prepilin-like proteins leader peptide-processing enzyme [Moorella sp. E308F]|uniref:prepilin peptidase n=1 Tax=unclassified Neomoorella TaxID=2676739 RepID=UPI0010FFC4AF|nr:MULTISPECIES: A24 family peptidase [unclassified Moorella (in: firmicutes)]GEA15413.1 type 4 prepilin-like proteins leader peptide-processing enzyme [Moorella sp. E308F]GEA19727.1 type 4 prepilin-like proteins leader peptide-processing enzyme [Moorella sp. E306M]